MASDPASELETLDVAADKVVVVDALNYLHLFMSMGEATFQSAFAPARFRELQRRVDAVAAAADIAGMTLIWVFDNGQQTDEALHKWRTRRMQEVTKAERFMPCSAETIFYAALERADFIVLYPPGIDGDDAVALLAWKTGGFALSGDRDLLRYGMKLPKERVFRGFCIHPTTGKLVLQPQSSYLPDGVSQRNLGELHHLLPADFEDLREAWGMREPTMYTRALKGSTKRGNADSFTATCGNLNFDALALVASVYSAVGTEKVEVTLPAATKDADGRLTGADLVTTVVLPDPCVAKALTAARPELAKQWLETTAKWPVFTADTEDERDRKTMAHAERAHAVCMLAAEISDAMLYAQGHFDEDYSPPQRILAFYEELVRIDPKLNHDTSVVRDDPLKWCHAIPCTGLSNPRACKTPGGGVCWRHEVAYANRIDKPPLCAACVGHLLRFR